MPSRQKLPWLSLNFPKKPWIWYGFPVFPDFPEKQEPWWWVYFSLLLLWKPALSCEIRPGYPCELLYTDDLITVAEKLGELKELERWTGRKGTQDKHWYNQSLALYTQCLEISLNIIWIPVWLVRSKWRNAIRPVAQQIALQPTMSGTRRWNNQKVSTNKEN